MFSVTDPWASLRLPLAIIFHAFSVLFALRAHLRASRPRSQERVVWCIGSRRSSGNALRVRKAVLDAVGFDGVVLEEQLYQARDGILFRSHYFAGSLELGVDDVVDGFLDAIEQSLAQQLSLPGVRLRVGNIYRPERAHAKFADHAARDLDGALNVV